MKMERRDALCALGFMLGGYSITGQQDEGNLVINLAGTKEVVVLRRSKFNPTFEEELRIPIDDLGDALARSQTPRPVE